MKIDGKLIAENIAESLKKRVNALKIKGVTPHLYIITFGENPNTESYLKQKKFRATEIGAEITIKRFEEDIPPEQVYNLIGQLNTQKDINGIIVQRPLTKNLDEEKISKSILQEKDVDGFNPNSNFEVPIALAIFEILKKAGIDNSNLEGKNIIIAGKGVTAGKPIINLFAKRKIKTVNVDSKTQNIDKIFKNADIIASATGKNIINSSNIKNGVILIGVGMHKVDGKLKGDYDEQEIKNIASFYTPTPGGVGPVNVTMLMKNLVEATENQVN